MTTSEDAKAVKEILRPVTSAMGAAIGIGVHEDNYSVVVYGQQWPYLVLSGSVNGVAIEYKFVGQAMAQLKAAQLEDS